jgi:hypothetical protein
MGLAACMRKTQGNKQTRLPERTGPGFYWRNYPYGRRAEGDHLGYRE